MCAIDNYIHQSLVPKVTYRGRGSSGYEDAEVFPDGFIKHAVSMDEENPLLSPSLPLCVTSVGHGEFVVGTIESIWQEGIHVLTHGPDRDQSTRSLIFVIVNS